MQEFLTSGFSLHMPSKRTSILVSVDGKSLSYVLLSTSYLKMSLHTLGSSSLSRLPIKAKVTSE